MFEEDDLPEDGVFRQVVSLWSAKIEHAIQHKRHVFQEDADACMSFYAGPKNWDELMGAAGGVAAGEDIPDPLFKMSVNKTFEFVSIFGPTLYYDNPVRTVKPRMPIQIPPEFFPDQNVYLAIQDEETVRVLFDQFRSELLERYLNWTPVENSLSKESRQAINEALIKGRGCLWTALRRPPGAEFRVVCSEFDSTDNLLVDPDAVSLDKACWIAQRCIHPVWQVEKDYGIKPGTLRGNMESQAVQAEAAGDSDHQYDRKRGLSNDLLVYHKIYSKMGIGGRLSGLQRGLRGPLEMFGDYCFIAIAKDVPYPLNLPPSVQNSVALDPESSTEVFDRVAWPTPFWADDSWPVSVLDFYPIANSPWPMAPLKAGMGELKFLNWVMSFLGGKLRTTLRDFIVVAKDLAEEIKTQMLEGKDLTMIEVESSGGRSVKELVDFLQHPPVNGDVWKMIESVEHNFDKRVGLVELMYGEPGGNQMRSATEADMRGGNMNIRPDDMSRQVEAWMADVAAREAVCARYHLHGSDVLPILGKFAAGAWDGYLSTQDINEATRQLEYRIEAGSTRRPNKTAEVKQMTEGVQVVGPILQAHAQTTGDVQPLNNLLSDWAKSRDLDPQRYLMQAPMMPAVAPAPGGEPGQEGPPQQGAPPTPGGPTQGEVPPFRAGP